MKKPGILKILFILYISLLEIYAQQYSSVKNVTDSLQVNLGNDYKLNSITIIPNSEHIRIGNRILSSDEYNFIYENASFKLSDSVSYSIFDTVFVSYQTLDLKLKKKYNRRELIVVYDTRLNDSVRVVQNTTDVLSSESIFGKNMQKSGTLIRGFTVGTTKDFTVSSGLRLQLSGQLAENIEIVAALTDENSPIQPEGNTERLEELDKVFIQIRHPNAIGTFGDYDFQLTGTEFGKINRKLQGLKGEVIFNNQSGTAAIAGSRGKFNSNDLTGTDGVQGPYRLTGVNNENDIIIIAGSERVYLDGEEMKRGENNDYTIEYSNAEITFTTKRLITSASRIYVDFEYTDRQFKRNFYGANYNGSFFAKRFKLNLNFMREGDDKNSPIDITISDAERKILEEAGDNRLKAVTSSITLAEPDSNGVRSGYYEKAFEIVSGDTNYYYIYNPGGANAIYNVVFTHVGAQLGDYTRESLGKYVYAGKGNGSYLPLKLLPLPQQKQMGNIKIGVEPFKDFFINAEIAGSDWDKNTFSELDSDDNYGYARNIEIKLNPKQIEIGSLNFGKAGFSYKDRFIENRFASLDRISDVEFNRYYNTTNTESANEALKELKINLNPVEQLTINTLYGKLDKGNNFNSERYVVDAKLNSKDSYSANYNLDLVNSNSYGAKTDWLRQNGDVYFTLGKFKPGFIYLSENKKAFAANSDSLFSSSLRYYEAGPALALTDIFGLSMTAKMTLREESLPLEGRFFKESDAVTHGYTLNYKGIREFNSELSFVYRNKKYTDKFKDLGSLNNETILIRSVSRVNLFNRFVSGDFYYEAATEKTAKFEKVFIRVQKGTGSYIYLGDLNNNGVADENEFQPSAYDADFVRVTVPTDELFPVINLKLNSRWQFEFSKIINGKSFIAEVVKPLSTETVWRVEENSREEDIKKIYFLDFSRFLNDSTTVNGSNYLQQDIHVFRNKTDFSLRFRFIEKRNLNQFNSGAERGYFNEKSIRLRFRLVKEITNQTDYVRQIDNNAAQASSNRSRLITGDEIISDFSYRPVNNLEVGFKIKVGRSRDEFPELPTEVNLNSQLIRFTLSFAGKGRLRAEFERSELSSNTLENYIPFEITKGNQIGKNYFWRFNFDYRFTNNLQSTISYDGRVQGAGKVVNTMRAEARAYF